MDSIRLSGQASGWVWAGNGGEHRGVGGGAHRLQTGDSGSRPYDDCEVGGGGRRRENGADDRFDINGYY